jgi:ectoine hydroxylase-related dioxygenase (phytanoyl-CoA dioxygenase family)
MAVLAPDEMELLPSDEDVAFYQEHGYYMSGKIFTDEEIDAALAGSERYYAGERDFPPPNGHETRGWTPADGNVLRKNDYTSQRNRELRALIHKPILGAIAARLCGSGVRLWHDQLLYKPPSNRDQPISVGWHTDRQYWMSCSSDNMLTAWIPFHDVDEEIGTITMIDGSHRWPEQTGTLDFWSADLEGMEARFETGGRQVVKVPMNLPKGHVSVHHCRTIHGSGPNLSDRPRRAIAVHMQDEANHHRRYYVRGEKLAVHDNDRLCRQINGEPDYRDPVFCPPLGLR